VFVFVFVFALLRFAALAAPARATSSIAPPAAPAAMTNPSPSTPPLQAFLLTGAPDSLADLQAHPGAIGVVYPTYFECSPGGEVVGAADAEVAAGVWRLGEEDQALWSVS
jgi:hypothetical protein